VIILCLGADVLLSLVPKGGFSCGQFDLTDQNSGHGHFSTEAGARDDKKSGSPSTSHFQSKKSGSSKNKSKKNNDVLAIHLIHGDILLLSGDNFEVRTFDHILSTF
jgi:hypothetical protein